jgi:hypothetical protein
MRSITDRALAREQYRKSSVLDAISLLTTGGGCPPFAFGLVDARCRLRWMKGGSWVGAPIDASLAEC